ncbi:MAG: nicotinate-nucleotide diphosphorylase (carboxylating), partial [Deltaproteobacteria bacterium]|nr:nicotinate-nucleotide diphosphorylase (carboxylating) [Deltaproteobacteria bacterium]
KEMKEAVLIAGGKVLLEASGGITLETIEAISKTGINLISVGAITHSAPSVDISLEVIKD